jgi:ADP-heptose:LPS heptosyltransferase
LEEGIVNEIWDRSDWNLKELLKKIKDSRCNAFLALMPYSASLKWNLVSMFLVKFARVKFASGWKKESTFLGKRWIKKTIFPSEMERLEKLLDELKFEELKWSTNDLGIQKITYSPEIPSIPYLVISPFSKGIANYWPTSNWIRLGIEIHKKNPYELVIVGGESDREKANEILSKWGNGRFVSVPIPELVLWLEQAEVIIGADSGCIHLANLLKKKNIALFGNSDYRGKWAHPENPNQIILYSNKECQKCLGKRHLECTCMNHLPLDEVLIAMDSYF